MISSINLVKLEKFVGGQHNDTLAELLKIEFLEMSSESRKGLTPEHLPPTEETAVQHALQVYLQITYWKVLSNTELDPRLWGWEKKNKLFEPIMTHKISYFLGRLRACQ